MVAAAYVPIPTFPWKGAPRWIRGSLIAGEGKRGITVTLKVCFQETQSPFEYYFHAFDLETFLVSYA